jgi:hypothetical protein
MMRTIARFGLGRAVESSLIASLALVGPAFAGTLNAIPADIQNDVKSAINQVIAAASRGDVKGVIGWTSAKDEERMLRSEVPSENAEGAGNEFSRRMESSYNETFSEAVKKFALPISVVEYDEEAHVAKVQVGESSELVELRLVNEGVWGDAWRIDAPDALTGALLASKIGEKLRGASLDEESDQRTVVESMATELLQPFSVDQE